MTVKYQRCRMNVNNTSDELQKCQTHIQNLEKKIEDKESNIEQLTVQFDTEKNNSSQLLRKSEFEFNDYRIKTNKEIQKLNEDLEKIVNNYNYSKKITKILEEKIRTLEMEQESVNSSFNDMKKEYRLKERDLVVKTSELKDLEATFNHLDRDYKKSKSQTKHLEDVVEGLEKRYKKLEEENRRCLDQYQLTILDKESMMSKFSSVEAKWKELSQVITENETHMSEDAATIAELSTKHQKSKDKLDSKQNELKLLTTQMEKLEESRTDLTRKLQEQEEFNASKQASFDKEKKKIVKANSKTIEELTEKCEEQRSKISDLVKASKTSEKLIKEMQSKLSDSEKIVITKDDLISALSNKIQTLKKRSEDADKLAELNLTKYRRAVDEINQVNSRADEAELQLARIKSRNRQSNCRFSSTSPAFLDN
ncbi:hypothetical protein GJ496_005937 [Pomphorhynchus laevis]|nr:hypothetical protein GJ496_005937 [Pomphorhynchus laevis]